MIMKSESVETRQQQLEEHYIQVHSELFEVVQKSEVFRDSKTFVDCIPEDEPALILHRFQEQCDTDDFDLKQFVDDNFILPQEVEPASYMPNELPMADHIQGLWDHLIRPPHEDTPELSTLIPLTHPYVVPGGRFREIYYWDSYFEAEGLAACGNLDIVEDMIRNCTYLIEEFGFVPNGNRVYYLTRSQPPVFAAMLEVLERHKGTEQAAQYVPHLEKEYEFWMDGSADLAAGEQHRHAVRTENGDVMNRYWDDNPAPRPESYREDIFLAQSVDEEQRPALYRHIRAAAESGWDFSSRWFEDQNRMETIRTTDLLPVDLNAMIYNVEKQLARWFDYMDKPDAADFYRERAKQREEAFDDYFWNEEKEYYFDYNWETGEQTEAWTLAAVVPLFHGLASQQQADAVANHLKEKLLEDGGLATTLKETGEQWDNPNGWAPLHWMAVNGLLQYGHRTLAKTIAERWLRLNRDVFERTGKLMEKYNVVDTSLEAGGGEYAPQDGFGWTNGVAIALLKNSFYVPVSEPVIEDVFAEAEE